MVSHLNLEGTHLRKPQFKVILAHESLSSELNVSRNKQLGDYNFVKQSCPARSVALNGCNFSEIDITVLKNTFENLEELEVSDNLFSCSELSKEQEEITEAKIKVECNGRIFK